MFRKKTIKKFIAFLLMVSIITGNIPLNFSVLAQNPTEYFIKIQKMNAPSGCIIALKSNGNLYGWSQSAYDICGFSIGLIPTLLDKDIVDFAAYGDTLMTVKKDGSLMHWGGRFSDFFSDGNISFGYGSGNDYMKLADNVAKVYLSYGIINEKDGSRNSAITGMIIKKDGSLWGFGANDYGQFGNGTNKAVYAPFYESGHFHIVKTFEPIKIMDNVLDVALGERNAFIIKQDGSLWISNHNTYKYEKITDKVSNITMDTYINHYIIKKAKTLYQYNAENGSLEKVFDNVKSVFASNNDILFITNNNELWFKNSGYYLNDKEKIYYKTDKPVKIMDNIVTVYFNNSPFSELTFIAKKDGTLSGWGYTKDGELGFVADNYIIEPVNIPFFSDWAVNDIISAGKMIPESFFTNIAQQVTLQDFYDLAAGFIVSKLELENIDDYIKLKKYNIASNAKNKNALLAKAMGVQLMNPADPNKILTQNQIVYLISIFAKEFLAPFSPALYMEDGLFSRRNFILDSFISDGWILKQLINEVIALSINKTPDNNYYKDGATLTRQQLAVIFCGLSRVSIPKDPAGKYKGGITLHEEFDKWIGDILDNIIKPNMTDREKIKAVYDYMIYNFKHNDDSTPFLVGYSPNSFNPLDTPLSLLYPIYFLEGTGTCDVFAGTFMLFAVRLGFECNYVSGYVFNSKSPRGKDGHGWNQIKINNEWFWLDVDLEGVHYRNTKSISYSLFLKKDVEWNKKYEWDTNKWNKCP